MQNFLVQEKKDEITAGFFNKGAYTERKNLLLVLKTGIAGMQYHIDSSTEDGQKLLSKLTPGTKLALFREPENEHDKWAIAVYTEDDEAIGHVTRFKNEAIARLMDYGKKFIAIIDDPEEENGEIKKAATENMNLPFSIYMED
ncbi:MAG: HIRAN domain-containing protein [Huintestinicola sp.]